MLMAFSTSPAIFSPSMTTAKTPSTLVPTFAPRSCPVQQAETNYKLAEADGSTDPTIGVWFTHNGSFNNPDALNTLGASVSIPLRIFDKNQGEKLRTKIDINRNEKLRQGIETQVYSDVDSAYALLYSNIELLKPYKRQYLQQAVRVRDTISVLLPAWRAHHCWTS